VSTIVVALGGNALARRGEPITARVQRQNVETAVRALAPLFDAGHRVVLTHGNGPQVGVLLLETEADTDAGPYPLDILGAESEGMIGYLLEQELRRRAPQRPVATLLTQTVVSADDPALARPSKPVGPMYDEATAMRLRDERGFVLAPDTGGWRRVVPSPRPVRLMQAESIRLLADAGVTVVASGGGGVPVTVDPAGRPSGVEGVVDKDLAAVVLARTVDADVLLLLTDVDRVYAGFGSRDQRGFDRLTVADATALLDASELGAGSMRPKVEACVEFASRGGVAVIAALEDAALAVAGHAGTRVVPAVAPVTVGPAC
jgi:carbamate kinase